MTPRVQPMRALPDGRTPRITSAPRMPQNSTRC